VQATKIEPFDYGFLARTICLIASERGERDDGETLVGTCRDRTFTT